MTHCAALRYISEALFLVSLSTQLQEHKGRIWILPSCCLNCLLLSCCHPALEWHLHLVEAPLH